MNRLVLVCALAACSQSHRAPLVKAGDSEADFAAQLKTAIGRDLVFDPAKHQLTGSNEVISTTNLYAEWQKTPEGERPAAMQKIAASFKQIVNEKLDWAGAQPRLRPVVRAINYFDLTMLGKVGAEGKTIPHVMLGDNAAIGVAIDSPDAMTIAHDTNFADWKVTPEQALAIATENLRAHGPHFEEVEPGVYMGEGHDSYDASRILLVDEIKNLKLPGGAVALIPNRETLLLAGAKDAKGLLAMAARADAAVNDPRPIHTIPLCLDGTSWKECVPDVSPAVKQKLGELSVQGRLSIYGDDHDPYQERMGDDIFVAHLSGLQKKTGEGVTYATWTKTVPTMLPKADVIAFVVLEGPDGAEKGKILGFAAWDRVMAVCGAHLSETGRLPRYWATGDWFPTDADLKKLALTDKP
jgi:uncharacterized protein YtpQ (UPF0354 family)